MKSTRRGTLAAIPFMISIEHLGIAQPNQRLIARRPVAEMKAEIDIVRNGARQARELLEHLRLVVGLDDGEVVLEHQHLLADVELNRQVVTRDIGRELVESTRAAIAHRLAGTCLVRRGSHT